MPIEWHRPVSRHSTVVRIKHEGDGGGLALLLVSSAARRLAIISLGLFSPLYIFGIAQSYQMTTSIALALTFGYFLLIFLAKLVALPFAEKLGYRFGFKTTIFLSVIPFLFFIDSGKKKAFGREMGIANFLNTTVMVISPILGAVIVQSFGFAALFWVAGAGMILSLLLLAPAKEHRPKFEANLSRVVRLIIEHKRVSLAYFGWGAEGSVVGSAWPIFLFIILGSALEVGGVVSTAAFVAAILAYLVGAWVDKRGWKGERELVSLGSPLVAVTWFMRAFAKSAPVLAGVDAIFRFGESMVGIPLDVLSYRKAREDRIDRAMLWREINITVGAIVATAALIVWVLLGIPLGYFFFVAAIFALLPLIAFREKTSKKEIK